MIQESDQEFVYDSSLYRKEAGCQAKRGFGQQLGSPDRAREASCSLKGGLCSRAIASSALLRAERNEEGAALQI
jgi:hypothetical protein